MKRNILYADKIISLKEPNSKASESEVVIVVGVVGEWHGHPNGSFKITAEDLKTIKENFDKQQTEIVIDYEHQTLYGTEAPAAGWISELMIEDDKLLAKVSWTEKAAEYIKNGEYKYISPVYVFDSFDNKTNAYIGIKLHSVALTNTPFLDELGEVHANKQNTQKEENMGKDTNPANAEDQKKPDAKGANAEDQKKPDAKGANAEDQKKPDAKGANAEDQKKPDAKGADAANQAGADADLATENEKLKEQLAETKVEAAIAANKITADQKAWAVKYCKQDPEGFEQFLSFQKPSKDLPGSNMYANKGGQGDGIDVVALATGNTK
ncbi:MAG: phage protease [Sulfurimonas sp.]|uniref:phage protease n=1 Tax=Sulfurimonas sp. TaxID=2022749 RepID=UPI003D0A7340